MSDRMIMDWRNPNKKRKIETAFEIFLAVATAAVYFLALTVAMINICSIQSRIDAAHERDRERQRAWDKMYGTCHNVPCKVGETKKYDDRLYVWTGSTWLPERDK